MVIDTSASLASLRQGTTCRGADYGDCVSYALALTRGEPLLFKGQDFAKTDINQREGSAG